MSKKKKDQNSPETPETKDQELSVSEALSEIADDLADSELSDTKDEGRKKKQKRQRTPEEEQERALNAVKRRKKLKHGTFAAVITLAVIGIIVLVNIICGMLDKRYHWNIDLTSQGLYELDEQTVNFLHQLTSDIDIGVMADESYFIRDNEKLKVLSETLERFSAESNGHIKFDYYDITKNPDAVANYSQYYSGELMQGDVAVKCGELVRVISFNDIIKSETSIDYTTYSQVTKYTFGGEQKLLSAIMGVTDLNPVKIAVIDKMNGGMCCYQYDQYAFAQMKDMLEKNNYEVTEVDIALDELSAEYDAAILCAPYNDLTESMIAKIQAYLENDGKYGKDLVYFGSPYQQQDMPNLNEFLDIWGISIDNAVIYDENTKTGQQVLTAMNVIQEVPALTVSDDELNSSWLGGKLPIVGPFARPVRMLFESNSGRTAAPLLTTPDTCYLYPISKPEEEDAKFDQEAAEHGSFNTAVVATTNFTSGSESYTSRLIVFGSAWFLDHYVVQYSNVYDNANYFISVMNAATGKENAPTIADKSLDQTVISITDSQVIWIRNITLFLIPLTVAIIGIIVYLRRRNK